MSEDQPTEQVEAEAEVTLTPSEASDQLPFEGVLAQLQDVVSRLDSRELSLEQAVELFERGVKLTEHGRSLLNQSAQRMEALGQRLGGQQ